MLPLLCHCVVTSSTWGSYLTARISPALSSSGHGYDLPTIFPPDPGDAGLMTMTILKTPCTLVSSKHGVDDYLHEVGLEQRVKPCYIHALIEELECRK